MSGGAHAATWVLRGRAVAVAQDDGVAATHDEGRHLVSVSWDAKATADRFDARHLLTAMPEPAETAKAGDEEEEAVLDAERYRDLPESEYYLPTETAEPTNALTERGAATSPPPELDAPSESKEDDDDNARWAHVDAGAPPSWLWFAVDASVVPRVPRSVAAHAAIHHAACCVRYEGGQADFVWRVRYSETKPFLRTDHPLFAYYTFMRNRPDIAEAPPPPAPLLPPAPPSVRLLEGLGAYASSDDDADEQSPAGGGGIWTSNAATQTDANDAMALRQEQTEGDPATRTAPADDDEPSAKRPHVGGRRPKWASAITLDDRSLRAPRRKRLRAFRKREH